MAAIEYSCLSVCPGCVFVSVYLSVYTITKNNETINLKLEHIVALRSSMLDIAHQGQGHGGSFSAFTTIQTFKPYISAHCWKL